MGFNKVILGLVLCVFASISVAAVSDPSVHGIKLGAGYQSIYEAYPDKASQISSKVTVKLNPDEKVMAYLTDYGHIYKLRYSAFQTDCYEIMDKLLKRFPADNGAKTVEQVLAKEHYVWTSNDQYTIGFTTCGTNRVNVHVTDNTVEDEAKQKKESGDLMRKQHYIANAKKSNF